jgi:hypothetical protein
MTPGVFMGDALYGDTGTGRVVTAAVSNAGLYLTSSYLGFYNGADWNDSVYIKSDGKFKFQGDANNYIEWDGANLTVVGDLLVQNPSTVRSDLNVENGATNNSSWEHSSDTTKIDGGEIYTNTITASQINGAGFGTLTISSGMIVLSSPEAIEIDSERGLYILAGGSLTLQSSGTVESASGKFQFRGHAGDIGFLCAVQTKYGGWTSVYGYTITIAHDSYLDDHYISIGGPQLGYPTAGQVRCRARDEVHYYAWSGTGTAGLKGSYISGAPKVELLATSGTYGYITCELRSSWSSFFPVPDNALDLGYSSNRWDDIYATNDVIQTSDERLKVDIEAPRLGLDFVQRLEPIKFRWADHEITPPENESEFKPKIKTHKRKHYGFSAQRVEKVLAELGVSTNDFAGFIHDTETGRYGTRMGEFVPVLWRAVQELSEQINLLEEKINV